MVKESEQHKLLKLRAERILKRLGCNTIEFERQCDSKRHPELGNSVNGRRYVDVYGRTEEGKEIFVECLIDEYAGGSIKRRFKKAKEVYILLIGQ